MDRVHIEETEPWHEGPEIWRVQDFFFAEDLKLRRHDYNLNIAGGFGAPQLTTGYVVANDISLPTKRRAYTRGPNRLPILDMLMVSIDISDVTFI